MLFRSNCSSKVNRSDIEDRFLSANFDCDKDALNLADFLFSSLKNKFFDKEYFDVVDAGLYNDYHWGIDAFKFSFMNTMVIVTVCLLFMMAV